MSHFTVMVIGENPEEQLAPFDENIEVDEYQREVVSDEDKKRFIDSYTNSGDWTPEGVSQAMLDENDNLSFEELYSRFGEDWNSKAWRLNDKGEWAEYSTYNPKSKWDWYLLGGRWTGLIKLKEKVELATVGKPGLMTEPAKDGFCDQAKKGDIENFDEISTFAVVKDGKWYEKGNMCWWGVVIDGKEEFDWEQEQKKLVESLPDDTLISIYDCHI